MDFVRAARVPTVAITLVNETVPLPRVEGDNRRIGQLAAERLEGFSGTLKVRRQDRRDLGMARGTRNV